MLVITYYVMLTCDVDVEQAGGKTGLRRADAGHKGATTLAPD